MHLITLLSNFGHFLLFRYHWTKVTWLYVKSTTNSVYQAFLLMINRRYASMFVTKIRQNLHRYNQICTSPTGKGFSWRTWRNVKLFLCKGCSIVLLVCVQTDAYFSPRFCSLHSKSVPKLPAVQFYTILILITKLCCYNFEFWECTVHCKHTVSLHSHYFLTACLYMQNPAI